MIRKLFFAALLVFQFSVTVFAADSTHVEFKPLKPEEHHAIVYQAMMQMISTVHYNKIKVDNDFSSKILDNYIKHLDPSRVYFTAADIAYFEQYRFRFDDALFNSDIQPAYDIYNRFQQRISERIDYTFSLLKTDFDYSVNDSFMFDRDNASWCNDTADENKLWSRKIKFECLSIRTTGKDFKSYSETIRKRYENLQKQISKTKSEDVFGIFMNSIAELADPHTNYFSPRIAEDFNNSMSLSLEGIGAQLQTDGQYTKIVTIIKGGPADSSKRLFANDKIIGVAQGKDSDMVNVIDWRIDDVVALIRGKKGTVVRLEIIPATEPNTTKIIILKRDKIKLEEQACKSSLKEITQNGKKLKIGVIHIPAFYIDFAAAQKGDKNYTSTTRDVKRLIEELKKKDIDGLILDLRNNGGGSLQEAVELTGLFIKSGPVVQVRESNGEIKSHKDEDNSIYYDGPLAVLVNRFSASASEIFAAAIQDYGRGIILGERTYGKGSVQNVFDLNNFIHINNKTLGQVKVTIAKFYRINGGTTQHNGVVPDILFPGIYDDPKYGEDGSPYALVGDQIEPVKYERTETIDKIKPLLVKEHEKRMKGNMEYKYLLEDIDYSKKADKEMYVSLNEKKYKAENEETEARKKKRAEERKLLYDYDDSHDVADTASIQNVSNKLAKPDSKVTDTKKENKDAKDLILSEGEFVIGEIATHKK